MAGHWKKMMDDKEMLYAHDLDNRDVTITIEKVVGGELRGENNKKSKKPIAHIKGKTKKLALNVTNCRIIEQLAGTPDPAEWAGMRVTIFPTTTDFGGKTVECIRVRPYLPKEKSDKSNGNGKAAAKPDLVDQIREEMNRAEGDPPPAADDEDRRAKEIDENDEESADA
jgi:hypothetical protein